MCGSCAFKVVSTLLHRPVDCYVCACSPHAVFCLTTFSYKSAKMHAAIARCLAITLQPHYNKVALHKK